MSRRPRTVREQRVARAIRRATAGGHVIASSAPVVRPSRVTLGGAAPTPPTYVGTRVGEDLTGSALSIALTPLPGDHAVLVAFANGSTWDTPSGWTLQAGGAVGDLAYRVWSADLTGSESWTVTGTGSEGHARAWVFNGGTGAVAVTTPTTSASTHTIAAPTPPAGVFRWMWIGFTPNGNYCRNPALLTPSRGQTMGGASAPVSHWNSYPEDGDWEPGDDATFWATYGGGVWSGSASCSGAAAVGISVS